MVVTAPDKSILPVPAISVRDAAPVALPIVITLAAASAPILIVPPDPTIANVLEEAWVIVMLPAEDEPTFKACAAAPVIRFKVPALVAEAPKMLHARVPALAAPFKMLTVELAAAAPEAILTT